MKNKKGFVDNPNRHSLSARGIPNRNSYGGFPLVLAQGEEGDLNIFLSEQERKHIGGGMVKEEEYKGKDVRLYTMESIGMENMNLYQLKMAAAALAYEAEHTDDKWAQGRIRTVQARIWEELLNKKRRGMNVEDIIKKGFPKKVFRSPRYSDGHGGYMVEDDYGIRHQLVDDGRELGFGQYGAIKQDDGSYKRIYRDKAGNFGMVTSNDSGYNDRVILMAGSDVKRMQGGEVLKDKRVLVSGDEGYKTIVVTKGSLQKMSDQDLKRLSGYIATERQRTGAVDRFSELEVMNKMVWAEAKRRKRAGKPVEGMKVFGSSNEAGWGVFHDDQDTKVLKVFPPKRSLECERDERYQRDPVLKCVFKGKYEKDQEETTTQNVETKGNMSIWVDKKGKVDVSKEGFGDMNCRKVHDDITQEDSIQCQIPKF